MALSPADFYAFSQATGSPVPEDPESRARIAPQVADWRRNQLKSPETKQADNSGLLNALGITAAVGGGAALLAGALGRRGGVRMGNAKQAARQAAQQVEVTDFGNVYTAAGRPAPSRPAPTPTPTAAAPQRPAGSRQGGIKFADLSQITGTEPRGLLRGRQPGGEITTVPGRGALTSLEITEVPVVDITEAAGQPRLPSSKDFIAGYFQKTSTPAGYLTEARRQVPADSQIVAVQTEKPASLVDRQQAIQSLVPDQAFNALDAAEDQMTGRVKQQLQRNEDLDMSQIDLLEEIAEYNRIQGMEQDDPLSVFAKSEYGQRALAKGYDINTVAKLKAASDKNIIGGLGGVSPELGGEGFYIETPDFRGVSLDSPLAQSLLQKAGITNEEINSFNAQRMQNLRASLEKDAPINSVASQLADGLPVDQAEGIDLRTGERFAIRRNVKETFPKSTLGSTGLVPGQRIQMEDVSQGAPDTSSAQRYLNTVRDEIASQLGEQGLSVSPERVEQELSNRFSKEAWTYGPKQTARRQALELYAQTGDPRLLENIRPQTIQFGSIGELPVSEFKKEVIMPETAVRAEEQYQSSVGKAKDWLGNIRVEVAPKLNRLQEEEAVLAEQHNMLMYALNKQPNAELAKQFGFINKQLKDNRSQQEFLNRRLEGATASTEETLAGISKQLPTSLADWSGEGMVVKPKLTSSPEFEYEGDILSVVEGLGTEPAEVVEGQLTYVPGGLLTGGRAKAIQNVGLIDETGEPLEINPASRTSIRGTGSMETYSDALSAKGVYGIERAMMGGSPTSPEASIAPSASPSSYRLPAGSRKQGKQDFNIVVAGGREYENYPELSQRLDKIISQLNIPPGMKVNILSGGARGADKLAERYAQEKGLGLKVYPADWEGQGLSAGMQRNSQMAEAGDVLVAFPGGSGTENMIQQMTQDFGKPAYRAADIQEPTETGRQSVLMSEAVRKGQLQFPRQQGPSQSLTDSDKYFQYNLWDKFNKPTPQKSVQLNLPSDIVPSVARARTTAADIATQQLESYMSKLQRGRSTPLSSEVRIQPSLF